VSSACHSQSCHLQTLIVALIIGPVLSARLCLSRVRLDDAEYKTAVPIKHAVRHPLKA